MIINKPTLEELEIALYEFRSYVLKTFEEYGDEIDSKAYSTELYHLEERIKKLEKQGETK